MSSSSVVPSQTLDLPAGRFHYLSWGAEGTDLPSMLLLHGITSSAQSWVRVGPALATLCWLLGTSVRKTRHFLRTDVPSSQHTHHRA
jgi:pimeloyl-ACP methyl ester carboxylesterase